MLESLLLVCLNATASGLDKTQLAEKMSEKLVSFIQCFFKNYRVNPMLSLLRRKAMSTPLTLLEKSLILFSRSSKSLERSGECTAEKLLAK